ncbi:MAG: phytanoyl-CoA dioxygenase family protein [Agriterribacter sp.]
MSIGEKIKRIKLVHWLYNLRHLKSLKHNREAYRKYGIHKPLFASISSKDFPDKTSKAWLDLEDSATAAPLKQTFSSFTPDIQEKIKNWSAKGYLIIERLLKDNEVDAINAEIAGLMQSGKIKFTNGNKLMFANRVSSLIQNITTHPQIKSILDFLLDKNVVPFQTINFINGSEQKAHSDSIHMTTYPLGYLIAAWIALEDITPDNGPLFYYPGSHKLPFLLNSDYNTTSSLLTLGNKKYSDYEDVLEEVINEKHFDTKSFLAKKGDVLIWHANLVHGGAPIINKASTRKSMVIHYYADDVIKYHEITERPSLLKDH